MRETHENHKEQLEQLRVDLEKSYKLQFEQFQKSYETLSKQSEKQFAELEKQLKQSHKKELAEKFAENGYSFVMKNFTWEVLLPKYVKFYQDLIKS